MKNQTNPPTPKQINHKTEPIPLMLVKEEIEMEEKIISLLVKRGILGLCLHPIGW